MTSLPNVKRPCSNCPFKKDAVKGWLGQQRMTEILSNGGFVCHKKTDKQCAGHMLIKGNENDFVNLAKRMGIELSLSGKELVFETQKECIEHHGDRA
jgi:hypothetical protein